MRNLIAVILFLIGTTVQYGVHGQDRRDSLRESPVVRKRPSLQYLVQDSARFARELEKQRLKDSVIRAEDSLNTLKDSVRYLYLKPLGPGSPNVFLDSLRGRFIISNGDLVNWKEQWLKADPDRLPGTLRMVRQPGILLGLFSLFVLLVLIRQSFPGEVEAIITSAYSNRILNQISKEDSLVTSWSFVFLYLFFGLTVGAAVYQLVSYYRVPFNYSGVNLFLILTGIVSLLFVAKIFLTRILGFVFGFKRLSRDYISALYLSYFNAAFLLLPLLLIFSLMPQNSVPLLLLCAVLLLSAFILFQLFRASNTLLKSYQVSTFYLFIYLCTLEVGPILILLKVLGI